jgi:hypothetical protein
MSLSSVEPHSEESRALRYFLGTTNSYDDITTLSKLSPGEDIDAYSKRLLASAKITPKEVAPTAIFVPRIGIHAKSYNPTQTELEALQDEKLSYDPRVALSQAIAVRHITANAIGGKRAERDRRVEHALLGPFQLVEPGALAEDLIWMNSFWRAPGLVSLFGERFQKVNGLKVKVLEALKLHLHSNSVSYFTHGGRYGEATRAIVDIDNADSLVTVSYVDVYPDRTKEGTYSWGQDDSQGNCANNL